MRQSKDTRDDGISLDGCRNSADIAARKELIRNACRHQERAHAFGVDDRRALPVRGADVPPTRMRVAPGALRRVSRIVEGDALHAVGVTVDLLPRGEWSA